MSDFKVVFNGFDLTNYIRVTSLNRGIGTDVTNDLVKVGSSRGKYFKSKTSEEKIIQMGFVMRYDLTEKRRELAGLLNVKEPAKLVFSDEPDKYYMAVTNGAIDLDENNFIGKGVIEWLVPEGIAWSKDERVVTDTDGAMAFRYDGTSPSFPRFEIESKSDNGFFGIVNQEGKVLQIGEPDEVDTVPYQRNERAINELFRTQNSEWVPNVGTRTYPNFLENPEKPNILGGRFDWTSHYESVIPVFPTNNKYLWAGTNINQAIKKTSEGKDDGNYQVKTRLHMRQVSPIDRGRMEVIVQNGFDIGAAIVLRDSSAYAKEFIIEMWVKGKMLHTATLKQKSFGSDFFIELEITKMQNKFTFKVSNIKSITNTVNLSDAYQKTFNVTDLGVSKATSVTLGAHKFSNKPANEMHFTNLTFDWVNVDKLEDVPNAFSKGDVVEIDNNDCSILLNGAIDRNLGAIGNDYFALQPGLNQIQFVWSEWAGKPDFKMFYREGWE